MTSLYVDTELGQNHPQLIHELEFVHDNNPLIVNRSYKLLGIHFGKHLMFDHHTRYLCTKLANLCSAVTKLNITFPPSICIKNSILFANYFSSFVLYLNLKLCKQHLTSQPDLKSKKSSSHHHQQPFLSSYKSDLF